MRSQCHAQRKFLILQLNLRLVRIIEYESLNCSLLFFLQLLGKKFHILQLNSIPTGCGKF